MHGVLMRVAFFGLALALCIDRAGAQVDPRYSGDQAPFDYEQPPGPGAPCSAYVGYWLQANERARSLRCVSTGDEWNTFPQLLQDFCASSTDAQRQVRTQQMHNVMNACSVCSSYVDQQRVLIASNLLYHCGFALSDFGRWSPNATRENQIATCIGEVPTNVDLDSYANSGPVSVPAVDAVQMAPEIQNCKLTHQPQGCQFAGCHSSNSSAATQTMPQSGSGLRNAIQQLPNRPKLKEVDVNDPCKPGMRSFSSDCKPSKVKVVDPGLLEGAGDLSRQGPGPAGSPGGGAGAPAASPTYNRVR